jgi:excisionase family DNA binding protein
MTLPQLAKALGVSRITVYNRVKSGKIRARKVGRNFIVPGRTVERLLGRGRITPAREQWITAIVRKAVEQYGEVFKALSHE